MELVEFLRARLDEDEQAARAATPGPWAWDVGDGNFQDEPSGSGEWGHLGPDLMSGVGEVISSCGYDGDNVIVRRADAEHIARHDPPRVLAEVEAKRRIVDEIAPEVERHDDQITAEWGGSNDGTAEKLLCLLALPYADHPDYRPEWKP